MRRRPGTTRRFPHPASKLEHSIAAPVARCHPRPAINGERLRYFLPKPYLIFPGHGWRTGIRHVSAHQASPFLTVAVQTHHYEPIMQMLSRRLTHWKQKWCPVRGSNPCYSLERAVLMNKTGRFDAHGATQRTRFYSVCDGVQRRSVSDGPVRFGRTRVRVPLPVHALRVDCQPQQRECRVTKKSPGSFPPRQV